MTELLEASSYAHDVARDSWDFAVDFERLRAAGLTINDLRWLAYKDYIARRATCKGCDSPLERPGESDGRLFFCEHSLFILTDAGIAFAASHCTPAVNGANGVPGARSSPALLPHWNGATRSLWLGASFVKKFKRPAANQERVLAAFEEEGWPDSIDDPLPPTNDGHSKRRLHDTIVRLNRSHSHRLIRFHGSGTGLAIHWQRLSIAHQIDTTSSPVRP